MIVERLSQDTRLYHVYKQPILTRNLGGENKGQKGTLSLIKHFLLAIINLIVDNTSKYL